jgi:type I restriction enzyme S subunit
MPDSELVCAGESGDDRELPGGWRFARLKDVATRMFGGGTPSTKNPKYWGGQIPWTTSAVIAESDTVLSRYQRSISEIALRESSTRIAPAGSLLIGTRVGVGKCVVTPFAVAINQDLTAVVVKTDAAIAEYIAFAFKLDSIRRWIDGAKRGTTIKGILVCAPKIGTKMS